MSDTATLPQQSLFESERFYRAVAAALPACVIGYSALIDPLLNVNLADGAEYGGVVVGSDQKSRTLTRLVIPAFLAIAVLLAFRVPPAIPERLKLVAAPCAAFLALAFASVLWAHASAKTGTLAVYQIILCSTLLISVAVSGEPRRILRYLLVMFAVAVAANLAALVLRPPGPVGHLGIYSFKNTLGAAGGCAFLLSVFLIFEGKLGWRALAAFTALGAAIITYVSGSKTAMAMILTAPFFAMGLLCARRLVGLGPLAASGFLLAIAIAAFATAGLMLGVDLDDVLFAVYGDNTFTGRTDIWSLVYENIQKSPWFGNGYRGFWSLGLASPKHASEIIFIRTIGSGHNGYLDIWLDLGAVGLALLLAYMLVSLNAMGKFDLRPAARSLTYISVFVFLAARNMLESGILWSTFFDSLCFVLVTILACYPEPPDGVRSG